MDPRALTVSVAVLAALICCTRCEEELHSTGLNTEKVESLSDHVPQKRSALLTPADEEGDILLHSNGFVPSAYNEDDIDKRGTLFRFGKREGSILRYGKRGSLFRFGKRQGSLFRFGKRGGTLFRFGRSGPSESSPYDDDSMADKRTLFRFGKRSDLDLLRNALAQYEYDNSPLYLDDPASKRAVDSFHWGRETEDDK